MAKKKMIIIGGGVAGLSTGIYAQMNEFETQIFEMHTIPGGQCTAWERGGYHFDYCLHWLVGTRKNAFHDIWKETHVLTDNVEVRDPEVFSLTNDTQHGEFWIYANIDRWQDYLLKLAPEDAKPIRKMCSQMKLGVNLEPFENPPSSRSWWDYVRMMLKTPGTLLMMLRYGKMPAKAYLEALDFKNERLRFFLMKMFGETNFSALVLILMLGWYHDRNAGYLVGGSLPIASRMTRRYKSLGGSLHLNSKVESIIVENDKAVGVRLSDGKEVRADIVIGAGDGHTTIYKMLQGKYVGPAFEKAFQTWKLFKPFVQISFGINAEVPSRNVMESFWQPPFKIGNFNVGNGYYFMNQSKHDPTLAPKGKTSLILRFESPWEDWEKLPLENYAAEKELIAKDATALLEKHYPGISAHIEVTDVATPLTGHRITGVWKGSFEGFVPEGNVMTTSLPDRLPGLSNFYLVGQWVFPGGGIPPAVQSGKWIVKTLCKENGMQFKVVTQSASPR